MHLNYSDLEGMKSPLAISHLNSQSQLTLQSSYPCGSPKKPVWVRYQN